MPITKDTETEIVIGAGWFLRALGWALVLLGGGLSIGPAAQGSSAQEIFGPLAVGIPFLLFGLVVLSWTKKITSTISGAV